ncbi:MAG: metallophosphoesterase [Nanoarchaeota archaeon]|nr:metallophosphoesterase [Nanoarchaeota archaeon]
MKIFITSDTHFNHKNIIKYACRPFKTIEEMNEEIIKRWNNKVGKGDIVIHLGDFGIGSKNEIIELKNKLNGTIILLRGNHDHKATREAGFLLVKGSLEIENLILSHFPLSEEEIPKGFINVHGHIHEKESFNGVNVSIEKTKYEPLELEKLKESIKFKENKLS